MINHFFDTLQGIIYFSNVLKPRSGSCRGGMVGDGICEKMQMSKPTMGHAVRRGEDGESEVHSSDRVGIESKIDATRALVAGYLVSFLSGEPVQIR